MEKYYNESREAKIKRIMEKFDKLSPEDAELFCKAAVAMHHETLKERLREQPTPCGEYFNEVLEYYKFEKQANSDEFMLIVDIFNYGRLFGIRSERARRKGKTNDYGILVDVNRRDSK